MSSLVTSRLRRAVLESRRVAPARIERCELCSEPLIANAHRHLMNLESREPICACHPCSMLFDRRASGGKRYRLIPDRRVALGDFVLDEARWESLGVPVGMAFFVRRSGEPSVTAIYPSPMGPTESVVDPESWRGIVEANPILGSMERDVEALLVRRQRDARSFWLVPIDECYRLVALVRREWRGLSGGKELWRSVDAFFEGLGSRSRPGGSA